MFHAVKNKMHVKYVYFSSKIKNVLYVGNNCSAYAREFHPVYSVTACPSKVQTRGSVLK